MLSVAQVVQIVPLCGSVLPSLCYAANAATYHREGGIPWFVISGSPNKSRARARARARAS